MHCETSCVIIFRVVALDMRGYGDSEKPPRVSDYNYDILQKDIVDLVKGLGKSSCTLVAHGTRTQKLMIPLL